MKPMNTVQEMQEDERVRYEHATGIVAESVDAVVESTVHRSPESFVESVACSADGTEERRCTDPDAPAYADGRSDALDVAETAFHNGRAAALVSRPGDDPEPDATVGSAAFGAELNARQYSGHVPRLIYGRADRESLWHVYERSVTAGIDSVRHEPFGDGGPTAYETESGRFDVEALLSDRLQIEPTANGRPAWDGAVPRGFAETLRAFAPDGVNPAFHFVWSYGDDGALGVPFPFTLTGVELLRAFNAEHGSSYEPPERVAILTDR